MGDWQGAVARAARAAGVARVVQITGLGADPKSPIRRLRWLGDAEARVAATGVKAWVLRPAVAMQSLLKHNPEIGIGGRLEAPFRRAKFDRLTAGMLDRVEATRPSPNHAPGATSMSGASR